MEEIRLTQFSKGSGCGCKIAPSVLQEILGQHKLSPDGGKVLVGNNSADDAAVYELENGQCLISTTDFFTPIVDDAFTFGQIAAANALSDVWAMGGDPVFALAILGWPVGKLPTELASRIMEGARSKCAEVGVVIAGGHSIDIPEPVFGLSVNGFVQKTYLKRNSTPQHNDVLFISKPLGIGILSTAQKRGLLQSDEYAVLLQAITALNTQGAQWGKLTEVHAMTDITGFGLIGHLLEMLAETPLSAELNYTAIPLLDPVKKYTAQFVYPDNTMRNWSAFQGDVEGINGESLLTLCDPQTNGGLLVAVDADAADHFEQSFPVFRIGKIIASGEKKILIR
ncbi:MAG TPA: selenide, water dikinase SelD [Flavobacteriales bacterium]|nr:selenide, water dikinase SelD [Flavobacteriales bacterium]HRE96405.1 selenide, water dikinase SelD [Flavobacteriales bacterium]HRJ34461.1 selenide, water dikinase SelD [Flavobacteriales bacterium]HRJ37540.1 selenide, water dikinase SelD [Flavobacteriales bacterium]